MRLLAWNIRQGGGSRLSLIADALKCHDADIVVLSAGARQHLGFVQPCMYALAVARPDASFRCGYFSAALANVGRLAADAGARRRKNAAGIWFVSELSPGHAADCCL